MAGVPLTLILMFACYVAALAALSARRYPGYIAAGSMVLAGILALLASRSNISVSASNMVFFELRGELGAAALLLNVSLALIVLGLAGTVDSLAAALLLTASAGGVVVLFSASIPVLIVGLEAVAASIAGLLSLEADRTTSLRYLVASFFASSLIVLGGSLLWAAGYQAIGAPLQPSGAGSAILGFVLLVAGIAVEVGLAPFHLWMPDVASRGPQLALAAAALASDAPLLLVLYRVVGGAHAGLSTVAATVLGVLAVASMVVGELSALSQTDPRRMIGFSMVSDAGYMMLLGIAEALTGKPGLWPAVYFATASSMAVAVALASTKPREGVVYGLPLAAGLLCLAGLPPFYGFAAKLAVITAFAEAGLELLAVIAAVFFIVAAAYNMRFVASRIGDLVSKPSPRSYIAYSLMLLALGIFPMVVYALGG